MQLKARQRGGSHRFLRTFSGRLLVLAVVGGAALVLVMTGAYLRGVGWFSETSQAVEHGLRSMPLRLQNWFVTPPRITIDSKHENVQKLAAKRDQAVAIGQLLTGPEDFVPATVRYTDEEGSLTGPLRALIRLKGDMVDHLEGSKWSFRVHLRGESALLGMKRFSLHHPQTRNYLGEWAYQRAMAREDVLTLRYGFVAVTVNGRDLGIYAMEEHFEKRLVEHNRRREGPIVRYNEDVFWREKAQQEVPFPDAPRNHGGDYSVSEVDGFQTGAMLANPVIRQQFVRAADRLARFRAGELKTSEVFNVDLLARFYALTDLFAADHGALWHNARFYYNPVTTELEPIAFDGNAGGPCQGLCGTYDGNFVGTDDEPPPERVWARTFADPVFLRAYVRQLERVADPAYLQSLLDEIRPDLEASLAILRKEFVGCELDEGLLFENQRYITSVLDPVRAMHAYARSVGERQVELELAAIQAFPVEVFAVRHGDATIAEFDPPVLVTGRRFGTPLRYHRLTIELPENLEATPETLPQILAELQVVHSVFGRDVRRSEDVLPFPRMLDGAATEGVPAPTDLATVPFVHVDEETKRILLRRGRHTLKRDLVIPAGYVVHCLEGTVFDLVESAVIVSRSPLEFAGTREDPVVIHSSDGTGQGLVVLGAGGRSTLSGVVFRGLHAPDRPGWKIPGAVTFYESPVTVDDCRFEEAHAEDALNVIRAPFRIERSIFEKVDSDAFDGDFCPDSLILDSRFMQIANDAIDVSGSKLEIKNVVISGAGDKGLSAGENSDMVVTKVQILDTEIAVASKDLSRVVLHYPSVVRCKVGFTAFQKKPEFGPSHITAHGLYVESTEVPFLIEKGSVMMDGSKPVPADRTEVEKILYGAQYGKSSR